MKKTIALCGSFDTKGSEFLFLKNIFEQHGYATLTIHVGSFEPSFTPDITNAEVAALVGVSMDDILASGQRGPAMKALSDGVKILLPKLYEEGKFDGVISLGGSGGTSLVAPGMRALPIGVPKMIVSTMAAGDVARYVGTSDLIMIPSIVDVSGLNEISVQIYQNAAFAMMGMLAYEKEEIQHKPMIAATMFGLTTPCVSRCQKLLEEKGYSVLVFHATGAGGKTMESLVKKGYFKGVLDLTTTEWCDELFGGILNAGPNRMEAAALGGVPQVVAPGALDMVNFGTPDSIPEKYAGRLFYQHNPTTTLMRTSTKENQLLANTIADKLSMVKAKTIVLLPTKGFSGLDIEGGEFEGKEEDSAFIEALVQRLQNNPLIELQELDLHINDPRFADIAVDSLLSLMKN